MIKRAACGKDTVRMFKHVMTLWVLFASMLVGVLVWWFVTSKSVKAIDDLANRMVGVVRVLAVEQAESFFAFPEQAVRIAQVADLNDPSEVQLYSSIAYESVNSDVVKVGIEHQGGLISYTGLNPSANAPDTLEVSSTLVNNTWTRVTSHAVVNGTVTPTPFQDRLQLTRQEDWYTDAVAAGGDSVWIVRAGIVPILTYAKAKYATGGVLTGVVASDLIVAKFVTNVIDFMKNVSPQGEIYIATMDGVSLVASGGIETSVLVMDSMAALTTRACGNLADLPPMGDGVRLTDYEVSIGGERFYVVWEPISRGNLQLLLVMVLSRADFRKEIDETYREMGYVLMAALPVLVFFSVVVSQYLTGRFVNVIRKTLVASLQGLDGKPTTPEVQPDGKEETGTEQLDQTPIQAVVRVLQALRTSLPTHDQWMLDKVVHKLVHSRASDLYTPHLVTSDDGDLHGHTEGIFTILRPATDQQNTSSEQQPTRVDSSKLPSSASTSPSPPLGDTVSNFDATRRGSIESVSMPTRCQSTVPVEMVASMEDIDEIYSPTYEVPSAPVVPGDLATIRAIAGGVDEWDFDVFQFHEATGGRPLSSLIMMLLDRENLVVPNPPSGGGDRGSSVGASAGAGVSGTQALDIPWTVAAAYFQMVEEGYYSNITYHTKTHGADTVHGTYYMLKQLEMDQITEFAPLDTFTLLLAAAVHDLRHIGVNNNFLVSTSHPLAIRYNDKSVLENFHVASAFQLMERPELNLLGNLEQSNKTYVRNLAIGIVLATDLAMSYDIIGKFKLQFCKPREDIKLETDAEKKEAKTLLLKMAMKCCDVASGTKPFRLHNIWTERVTAEFFRQGDMERALDMPVASFMDRTCCDLPKSQQGFLGFVVKPIYMAMAEVFPRARMFVDQIIVNIETWKQKEHAGDQPAKAERVAPASRLPSRLPAIRPMKANRVAPSGARSSEE